MVDTNTALERAALNSPLNLSDAHARASLGPIGAAIVPKLPAIFHKATRVDQRYAEEQLTESFERLARLQFPRRPQISYSTSALVLTVAQHLRQTKSRVHLLEPGFDNIRDLLWTSGIDLIPVTETSVAQLLASIPATMAGDVLWVTSPSNPTGWALTAPDYQRLAESCAAADVLLVVDHCFRFFSEVTSSFDQYRILESVAGLDYVTLEDTGKTTALLDIKIGLAVVSQSLAERLRTLNEELLLNVSPFLCLAIAEALDALADGDLRQHLIPLVQENRTMLVRAFRDMLPAATFADRSESPLLWVDTGLARGGQLLARYLRELDIHVLPGDRFYFDPVSGSDKLRVALVRDTKPIMNAVSRMSRSADSWYRGAY